MLTLAPISLFNTAAVLSRSCLIVCIHVQYVAIATMQTGAETGNFCHSMFLVVTRV